MTCVTSEIIWSIALLKDFGVNSSSAMVYYNNQAAIHLASNQTFHERLKHEEISITTISSRKKVNDGLIKFVHVKSQHQLADLLIKALPFFFR